MRQRRVPKRTADDANVSDHSLNGMSNFLEVRFLEVRAVALPAPLPGANAPERAGAHPPVPPPPAQDDADCEAGGPAPLIAGSAFAVHAEHE